jgi:DNA (cytosine-5)-methyltransferase 1
VKYLSVCSGIEAATVAWEPLGWEAVGFSEIEAFPRAVLAHHYPHVPLHGDFTALIEDPPLCDVLVGGTPCQAFSVAGARRSLDDARGNLSLAYVELANAIDRKNHDNGREACITVWENVPGVFSTKDNAFGCFLRGLAGSVSGEDVPLEPPGGKWTHCGAVLGPQRAIAWRVLDAQYFGLAQRRRRVFVVASAREGFDPTQVLFEWEGLRRDSAPSREARQEAPAPLGGRVAERDGVVCPEVSGPLGGAGQSGGFRTTDLDNNGAYIVEGVHVEGVQAFDSYNGTVGEVTPTLCTLGDHATGNAGVLQTFAASAIGDFRSSSLANTVTAHGGSNAGETATSAYVLAPAAPEPAAPEPAAPEPAAHMVVRRLTPRECERLQGFPDDFSRIQWKNKPAGDCPDGPRYKALGNSMAVPVMRWIGRRIDEKLKERP